MENIENDNTLKIAIPAIPTYQKALGWNAIQTNRSEVMQHTHPMPQRQQQSSPHTEDVSNNTH